MFQEYSKGLEELLLLNFITFMLDGNSYMSFNMRKYSFAPREDPDQGAETGFHYRLGSVKYN